MLYVYVSAFDNDLTYEKYCFQGYTTLVNNIFFFTEKKMFISYTKQLYL